MRPILAGNASAGALEEQSTAAQRSEVVDHLLPTTDRDPLERRGRLGMNPQRARELTERVKAMTRGRS